MHTRSMIILAAVFGSSLTVACQAGVLLWHRWTRKRPLRTRGWASQDVIQRRKP